MKALTSILILLALPLFGQDKVWTDSGNTLTAVEKFASIGAYEKISPASFENFLDKLEKKKQGMLDKEFLQYVFTRTHQTWLRKYVPYSSFGNLFTDGSYHCLTGTILYALILEHFSIEYEVIETNYHIFLMASTAKGKVLIEATDPRAGFVDSPTGIEMRISSYKKQMAEASGTGSFYHFSTELFRSVTLNEMTGLLYYNKSVDLLNKGNIKESVECAIKANEFYDGPRMDEFSQILLLTIQQSELDTAQKKEYAQALVSMRQRNFPAVASIH